MPKITAKRRRCLVCQKLFAPEYDTHTIKQTLCSHSCCVIFYDKHKPKSRKLARVVAAQLGKRSMGEVRFYASNIEGKRHIVADYEPDTFQYRVEETKSYTPDFRIQTKSGETFYVEYKGVLDLETRKKMVRVRDQNPDVDIRFVFQKACNAIRKGSKTSYSVWAEKNGFQWADNYLPKEWLI